MRFTWSASVEESAVFKHYNLTSKSKYYSQILHNVNTYLTLYSAVPSNPSKAFSFR